MICIEADVSPPTKNYSDEQMAVMLAAIALRSLPTAPFGYKAKGLKAAI
jgi:hypothetical protein